MSTIKANTSEAVYKIDKFLGLHESPDGDNALKLGEASRVENWRVTRDLNLKRRPGIHTLYTLGDEPVNGMWYGNINGVKTGLAACSGHLWKIYEDEDYLAEPQDLGEFDTSNRVNFFAYSDIVYILNGEEYMSYDGVAFKQVTGYIPIVAVARTPNGSASTLLEEVNKLNNMRRVWFSPDGEDNVFVLPEKDILSVHYVKNLGTNEYILPEKYNVDRLNGKVTFGKDTIIEYDGINDTYVVSDEDIADVGSIEVNGQIPTSTYTADRDGVTFDVAPKYGQVVTLKSGTEFEEDFTGDGETTEFALANTNIEAIEVLVDGARKYDKTLYDNTFPPESNLSAHLDLHYNVEVGDVFEITSHEVGEITSSVTIPAHDNQKDTTGINLFGVAGIDHLKVVDSGGNELEEISGLNVVYAPYPEDIEIDEEAFLAEMAERNQDGPTAPYYMGVGTHDCYFFYNSVEEKWHFSNNEDGRGGLTTTADSTATTVSFSTLTSGYSNITLLFLKIDNTPSRELFEGRDFTYTTSESGQHTIITCTLNHDLHWYANEIGSNASTSFPLHAYYTYKSEHLGFCDLSEFGITYNPKFNSLSSGDLVHVSYSRNFAGETIADSEARIYIMPDGKFVTSNTTFTVTQYYKGSYIEKTFYGVNSGVETNTVYYVGYFKRYQTNLANLAQESVEVKVKSTSIPSTPEYSYANNKITFVEAPAEGANIVVNEIAAEIEKAYNADGETFTFLIGAVGAKEISVEVDDANVDLDRNFTFDPDTMTITILDTADMEAGDVITVKGKQPPARGVNTIEICYSAGMAFTQTVNRMTNAEIFLGVQDNAVFLYGDGSNKAFYSGIDYNGKPRADYFPDLNEMAVADNNTAITGLIRHYSQLICFKEKSAYTVQYGIITQADGLQQYGFYITPINKAIGCSALGQVRLVLNSPYAPFGHDLYQWTSNSRYSAALSADERNAKRISDRIYATLGEFNLAECYCYDDNDNQEYYIWYNDKALVYNYAADAWYVYTGLDVTAMCNLEDDVLVGTEDGEVCKMSDDYYTDDGTVFDSYWESGSIDFGKNYMRKFMSELWVGLKPDAHYSVTVSGRSDRKETLTIKKVSGTAGTNTTPFVKKMKIKAKKFAFLKLILESAESDSTATVVSLSTKIRETGYSK